MTEKDLKKLNRQELLEVLLAQSKKIDRLQAQLKETQDQLTERELAISEAGSIAEASLVLNNVFADAQKAADQYLENIRRMHDHAEQEFAESARMASQKDRKLSEQDRTEAEAAKAEAERIRAEAEADRVAAAQHLEEISRLKEQTERECAECKKRADKQIRHSLIRTKKAVQQMMNLYAAEVMKRMTKLHEWDKQMEALRERENNKRSARSEK